MDHSVLTILDLGIIAAYLVIMVLVGVYSVRRIQNTKDYYVAGRSFGPMVLMATVCATIIGGSGLMGRAGVAYTDGFKAVLTAIPYLLGSFSPASPGRSRISGCSTGSPLSRSCLNGGLAGQPRSPSLC